MQWFVGVRRDEPAAPAELDATYHIVQATPIIFFPSPSGIASTDPFRPRTHSALDVATASSFEVRGTLESPTNRPRTHRSLDVATSRSSEVGARRGDHQQIIGANADRSRTRGRPQRTVPTSHRQPLRPARPCSIRHQISTKHLDRRERSNRKNDRPAKTINTSTRPRTHRQEQLSQRTSAVLRAAAHDVDFRNRAARGSVCNGLFAGVVSQNMMLAHFTGVSGGAVHVPSRASAFGQ